MNNEYVNYYIKKAQQFENQGNLYWAGNSILTAMILQRGQKEFELQEYLQRDYLEAQATGN